MKGLEKYMPGEVGSGRRKPNVKDILWASLNKATSEVERSLYDIANIRIKWKGSFDHLIQRCYDRSIPPEIAIGTFSRLMNEKLCEFIYLAVDPKILSIAVKNGDCLLVVSKIQQLGCPDTIMNISTCLNSKIHNKKQDSIGAYNTADIILK